MMECEAAEPIIFADDVGIHLPAVDGYIVVDWGEIAQVCALREQYADGRPFINVSVDHISGQASIATCEKILGCPLNPVELACIQTGFENGRIVGCIVPPLCRLLVERQRNGNAYLIRSCDMDVIRRIPKAFP